MLAEIFAPHSVAVVGASPDPSRLGHVVLRNLIEHGFAGPIFPIHPKAHEVLGRRAYPSVLAVPESIELVVIAVPARQVLQVVDQCGQKGVKGLVVISSGFKEVGGEGRELDRQLLAKVRAYGMRMIGPNSLGVIDTHSRLNTSFAALMPDTGNIALMSQSGAICTAILDWSKVRGVGFSHFVSLGNKTDIDEVMLLRAWGNDPRSKVVLAYLEDISDGPAFIAAAREVTRTTPVVAIKSGTTAAGSLAASHHTGSLAGSEQAYEAAFAQSGIIRAHTVSELFDLAMLLAYQPLIKGNRVAILTNSGGMGIIAADAVERSGLAMASLSPSTIEHLQTVLPASASAYNPIDLLGDALHDLYGVGVKAALADANVDGLIVVLTPQAQTELVATAEIIAAAAAGSHKPVVASFMGGYSIGPALETLNRHSIPSYTFPERAVQSLASMYHYVERIRRPPPQYRSVPVNLTEVRRVLTNVRAGGRVELSEGEVRLVLAAYGLRIPESRLARSPDEAANLGTQLGFPIVMKVASPDILLKSAIGAVRLGVADADAARDSFELIDYRARKYWPGARIHGVYVQEMVRSGRDLLISMSRDPQFGPLIATGLCGIYVDVLKDITFGLAPLSEQDVYEQLRALRAFPLLRGADGGHFADVSAIEDVLLRVSQLATELPEIVELDINPLVVHRQGEGAVVLDARIILQ
ncbi:MAG: CoA-binding protein [Candidatus Viridilinea halotolerans]|uniref:CoA-binding protein n=1 Tax=Candidatus Viridilinea halotolerans TaxID=2491704 RepID=A0A426TZW7_9CHLR|nr:MAG: CoA-binding protein [Candidatus Viridilinea halotolerans]